MHYIKLLKKDPTKYSKNVALPADGLSANIISSWQYFGELNSEESKMVW